MLSQGCSISQVADISDHKLNKAVVLADVSFEDVLARAKYTLKASTI